MSIKDGIPHLKKYIFIPFLRSRERGFGEARADGLMSHCGKPGKAEQHVGALLFTMWLHFKLEQKGFNTGLQKLKGRVKNRRIQSQ